MYGLEKKLKMSGSAYTDANNPGVGASPLISGGYDMYSNIREAGGRATMAGKGSENARKENQTFVDADGMQGLEIDFAYVSNKEDADNWRKNGEKISRQAAASFASGINAAK